MSMIILPNSILVGKEAVPVRAKPKATILEKNVYSKKAYNLIRSLPRNLKAEGQFYQSRALPRAKQYTIPGCQERILIATNSTPPKKIVLELTGFISLDSEGNRGPNFQVRRGIFYYDGLKDAKSAEGYNAGFRDQRLVIDTRRGSTDAQFVRRSCKPNCVIKHVTGEFEPLGLALVATQQINYTDEITIPFDDGWADSEIPLDCVAHLRGDVECPMEIHRDTKNEQRLAREARTQFVRTNSKFFFRAEFERVKQFYKRRRQEESRGPLQITATSSASTSSGAQFQRPPLKKLPTLLVPPIVKFPANISSDSSGKFKIPAMPPLKNAYQMYQHHHSQMASDSEKRGGASIDKGGGASSRMTGGAENNLLTSSDSTSSGLSNSTSSTFPKDTVLSRRLPNFNIASILNNSFLNTSTMSSEVPPKPLLNSTSSAPPTSSKIIVQRVNPGAMAANYPRTSRPILRATSSAPGTTSSRITISTSSAGRVISGNSGISETTLSKVSDSKNSGISNSENSGGSRASGTTTSSGTTVYSRFTIPTTPSVNSENCEMTPPEPYEEENPRKFPFPTYPGMTSSAFYAARDAAMALKKAQKALTSKRSLPPGTVYEPVTGEILPRSAILPSSADTDSFSESNSNTEDDDRSTSSESSDEFWEMRCHCGLTHEDGDTIECSSCKTWQHMACMGLAAKTMTKSETYLCEVCDPRNLPLSRADAARKQREILKKFERDGGGTRKRKKKDKNRKHRHHRHPKRGRPSKSPPTTTSSDSPKLASHGYSDAAGVLLESIPTTPGAKQLLEPSKRPRRAKTFHNMFGILATENIRVNQVVLVIHGWVTIPEEVKRKPGGVPGIFLYCDLEHKGSDSETSGSARKLCVCTRKRSPATHIRRSCNPNCSLSHALDDQKNFGLIVIATHEIPRGAEITLPFDSDWRESVKPLRCVEHYESTQKCPLKKERKAFKAQQKRISYQLGEGSDAKKPKMERSEPTNYKELFPELQISTSTSSTPTSSTAPLSMERVFIPPAKENPPKPPVVLAGQGIMTTARLVRPETQLSHFPRPPLYIGPQQQQPVVFIDPSQIPTSEDVVVVDNGDPRVWNSASIMNGISAAFGVPTTSSEFYGNSEEATSSETDTSTINTTIIDLQQQLPRHHHQNPKNQ
ncbi:hypothetical protein L3Y34_002974 [Caenorhabditis briggsae]|uniref:SET domain-containing protein n=1 Tax=Caenorhabditis briggsae TaxID=6238 RepID=A0AAE9A992_CAEBR|nr:hypothetical protein L3Y34_002974 [Caenorhabditis briggsae]